MLNFFVILFCFALKINVAEANSVIDSIIKDNPSLSIAILVKDLKTGDEIYSYNSNKLMIPASVTKSFTVYAALSFLKPDFTYKTSFLTDKKDNLYIKFSGDPSLKMDDLLKLIDSLPKKNYKNIYVDDTEFDQTYNGDGWSIEDSKFCFAAPSSALVINKNCFQLTLQPSLVLKKLAIIKSSSKNFAHINNEVITLNNPSCLAKLTSTHDNYYNLTGCIDINAQQMSLNIAYQNPRDLIKSILKDKLKGSISFKAINSKVDLIAEHESESLDKIIIDMHKDSDNITANNIAKTIGASYYKTKGNFDNANKAIIEILAKEVGINSANIRLIDGSGLSRHNLVSANQLVSLFSSAYNSKIGTWFYNSLPISAVDGSLKDRFIESPTLHGKIYAKTGSMKGVSALAGFIDNELVFAIMFNGYLGKRNELAALEDQILVSILQENNKNLN